MIYDPDTKEEWREMYASLRVKHSLPLTYAPLFVTANTFEGELICSHSRWPGGDVLLDPTDHA